MPTIPIVKPDRPMTLQQVDRQLDQFAAFMRRTDHGVEREAAVIAADRLLDVRLAIMIDGEA